VVSWLRVVVALLIVSTLASAIAGLWVYNSHISPLKALASKPALGDVLDRLELLDYTMDFDGTTWRVVIENSPSARNGTIKVYDVEGRLLAEYRFNYTKTLLLELASTVEGGNVTLLNPIEYLEAFATNIKFNQTAEGTITGVTVFPGIAPLYALTYIGNATLIDWSSFYKPRGQHPQWVSILFTKVKLGSEEYRGVEVIIQQQQAILTAALKWYQVSVLAKLANVGGVAVASELTMVAPKPGGEALTVNIKVEEVRLRQS